MTKEEKLKNDLDKYAKNKINAISSEFYNHFVAMDIPELEAVIRVSRDFNHTNCPWLSFYSKDLIIKMAQDRISFISSMGETTK